SAGMLSKETAEAVGGGVQSLAFSGDGNTLISAGAAKNWQARSTADLKLLRAGTGHNFAVYAARYNPTFTRVATLDYSGQLFIWDAATGLPLHHQQLPAAAGYSLAYAPEGIELYLGTSDP